MKTASPIIHPAGSGVFAVSPSALMLGCNFPMEGADPCCTPIFFAVTTLLEPTAIQVADLLHLSFMERYTFQEADKVARANLMYKKDGQISSISWMPNAEEDLKARLTPLLGKLVKQRLSMPHEQENIGDYYPEFPKGLEFLENGFEVIQDAVKPVGISIVQVKHHPFLEVYTFAEDGSTATFNLYYKGHGQFSKIMPVPTKSSSTELIQRIKAILESI